MRALLPLLKTLLSRYLTPGILVGGFAGLVGAGLWWFTTHVPATPGAMSRAAIRQTTADIRQALGTVATDTPRATTALAAGRAHLDSAASHAQRATRYHQQASSHAQRHPTTTPAASPAAAARELQRQFAGH